MKRFLFIPSCALLALSVLTSCQKEDKSALELSQELTAELQKVTDYRTAEASAARVAALNKRLQDATVRPTGGSLSGSDQGDAGAAFANSMVALAREMGRVRSSIPQTEAGTTVDDDMLVMATGVSTGTSPDASASARKAAGMKYLKHDLDSSNAELKSFEECYGSAKLREALSYTADPGAVSILGGGDEVPAIPEATEPAEAPEEPADAEEPAADEEPAPADDEEPAPADDEEPAPAADDEEPAPADDTTDGDVSIDVEADDSADSEEPAADDEEPAADDEEPAADDAGGDDLDLDISIDEL